MKAAWIIATVLSALGAGIGGGFVAVEMLAWDEAPRQVDVAAIEPEVEDAGRADNNSGDVREIKTRLAGLEARLIKTEDAAKDNSAHEEIDALKARIAELEKAPVEAVAETDEDGNVVVASPGSDAFKDAVNEAIEKREAEERAERAKQRETWMKNRMESSKERIVTTMTEKLSLTALQQENVKTVLDDYNTKRMELWTKGMEARRSGEEFDWQTERATIESEAKTAIEAELTLSQVSTFQELLGDEEIDDIGEEEGGRRGRRGNR